MRTHSHESPSRPLAALISTLLIALAPAACTRESSGPSEAYEQARQRFSKLYAQKLDQAFVDPQMEEIEALLAQVPADSMDAQPARELQQRIQEGRARMQAAQQETEEAIASARRVEAFPSTGSTPSAPEPTPVAAPVAERDAGTSAGPVPGTPASELSGGYQGCFRRGETVTVTGAGSGKRDTWEMEKRIACEQAYPSFVGQLLVIEEGRVLTVLPKSAVRVTYVGPDGGVVPDAGR